ncbi:cytochrome P450 [Streptomyces sp. NPDC054775]
MGPVAPVELAPGVYASLVTSYDAALRVLRDPATFSKDARRWKAVAEGTVSLDSPVMPLMEYRPSSMWTDGEDHRRRRTAVEDSLNHIDPNGLRGYVEETADALIDTFYNAGHADLLTEYTDALPLLVLTRILGAPAEYGERLLRTGTAIFAAGPGAKTAQRECLDILHQLVVFKRTALAADVTSWMISHPLQLTDEEIVHELSVLFVAGTQPQRTLIANTFRLLLSDDRFADDLSDGSLRIDDALDEVLWKDPPLANFCFHYPIRDVMLEGVRLRKGEPVVISLAAVSNDPAQASERRVGNRAHLAWGAGAHACPAQSASRLIAAVAIEKLLDRLPDVQLAVPPSALKWRQGPFLRALLELPVTFPIVLEDRLGGSGDREAEAAAGSFAGVPTRPFWEPKENRPSDGTSVIPGVSGAVRAWRRLIDRWMA